MRTDGRGAKENTGRPPAGGGRLRAEGASVALLGFSELDECILERELNERCALIEKDIENAEYLIYDPAGAALRSEWPRVLRREEEGTLVALPLPVCKLWLRRSADMTAVRAGERPALIRHFLTHEKDWAGSLNGADAAAEQILAERHAFLLDAYSAAGDTDALLLLLDALRTREEAWTAAGDSDGFYTYTLAEEYLNRSVRERATETAARLLDFMHTRFGGAYPQAAEKAQREYAFGERNRPRVYWSCGTRHTLGAYPQTAAGTDRTPVEWTVLERKEDRALLLSRYVLDRKPYNAERTAVTWELCTLRRWLNGPFLKKTFDREEKARLIRADVPAARNTRYTTSPGADTRDRVFLLSPAEAERYLPTAAERMAAVTGYSDLSLLHVDADKYKKDGRMTLMWWLRGNSSQQQLAPYIDGRGNIAESGNYADYVFYGLRPAVWVRID